MLHDVIEQVHNLRKFNETLSQRRISEDVFVLRNS